MRQAAIQRRGAAHSRVATLGAPRTTRAPSYPPRPPPPAEPRARAQTPPALMTSPSLSARSWSSVNGAVCRARPPRVRRRPPAPPRPALAAGAGASAEPRRAAAAAGETCGRRVPGGRAAQLFRLSVSRDLPRAPRSLGRAEVRELSAGAPGARPAGLSGERPSLWGGGGCGAACPNGFSLSDEEGKGGGGERKKALCKIRSERIRDSVLFAVGENCHRMATPAGWASSVTCCNFGSVQLCCLPRL